MHSVLTGELMYCMVSWIACAVSSPVRKVTRALSVARVVVGPSRGECLSRRAHQSGRDDTTGAVDIHADLLVRCSGLQEQELGCDQSGGAVVNGPVQANDSLAQQSTEDVECALPTAGLLYDHRNKAYGTSLLLNRAQATRQRTSTRRQHGYFA
jgi:hypothetical protein